MRKIIEYHYDIFEDTISSSFYDKDINIDDIIENGKRIISYILTGTDREPIEKETGLDKVVDTRVMKFLHYISTGTLPAFKHIKQGEKLEYNFDCIDGNHFNFKIDFPIDVYVLELDKNIFVFSEMVEDFFDISNDKIYNEINFINDEYLLITDYRYKEIYAIDNQYNTIFSGKINNKGEITNYKNKDGNMIYHHYDKDGELISITSNSDEILYVESVSKRSTIHYFLIPFIKTSKSAEISKSGEYILYSYEKEISGKDIFIDRYYDMISKKEFEMIKLNANRAIKIEEK